MSELAVHYVRKTPGRELTVAVLKGSVTRVHVPDDDAKAHFVTAMLKARCESDEELELFGETTSALRRRERERLRARIGAVSPVVGLMANLNAWENISLPAAYHAQPSLTHVAKLTEEVLAAFGIEPRSFLSRLPEELGMLERKVAAFIRLLVAAPELALIDALDAGLSRAERARAAVFEAELRLRLPTATVVFVDAKEQES
jgi:ABC-type transporter Mla maintaining outer membrane lipid asymmetry ATPase subunit MlaF